MAKGKPETETETETLTVEEVLRRAKKQTEELFRAAKLPPGAWDATISFGIDNVFQYVVENIAAAREAEATADGPISTEAAAKLLFVSRPHVVKLIEEGTLPLDHVTGQNRFVLRSAVLAYKAQRDAAAKAYFTTQNEDSEPLGL
jgi:excisionase family DNA binding protein